jgi:hypothetical protein
MIPIANVLCQECDKPLYGEQTVFCSRKCSTTFYNRARKVTVHCLQCESPIHGDSNRKYCSKKCQQAWQTAQLVKRWQDGKENGWHGKTYLIAGYVRDYLFKKFHNRCQECGWSKVNKTTGRVPLQVDHVDGNPSNCRESNLKLLCPNCHSLTPTFGRLNKESCRCR